MPLIPPAGAIVTAITPFTPDGSAIDYATLDRLVDWYLASGCAGIFSPCLSSEMFQLSPEERLELAGHVSQRVRQQCTGAGAEAPVVVGTGTYGGPIEEQASFVNQMAAVCDAVVVNTALLAAE